MRHQQMSGRSGMGLDLNLPTLDQLLASASAGAQQQIAANLAQSQSVQQAATNAAGTALGTKIVTFYKTQPLLAWGITGLAVMFLVYGGMSFARGK